MGHESRAAALTGAVIRLRSVVPGGASALAGGLLGLILRDPVHMAAAAALAGAMGAIAFSDVKTMRVPDAWIVFAIIIGFALIALRGYGPQTALGEAVHALLDIGLCAGAFLLLREAFYRLRGVAGLGLGDAKLAAVGSLWLGWQIFAVAVALAATVALVWVAALAIARRSWSREQKIPFAAFLAPSIWICWYGAQITA